jgi:tetratricopeptide (TPR) repeat protein
MHFQAGNLDEASKVVEEVLAKAPQSKDSLDIFVNEQQKQKVPIMAAVLNFKGYIYAQKRNLPEAKKYFESAIRTFPDFVMAKRNLQQIMGGGPKRP